MLVLAGSIQLCLTGDIYAEYEEVLSRPRLRRTQDVVAAALQAVRDKAVWVKSSRTLRVCSDADDDIFIECAQTAHADYVVTGNLKHFPASFEATKVVSPRQLLELVSEMPGS